jgi:hypothetical protein
MSPRAFAFASWTVRVECYSQSSSRISNNQNNGSERTYQFNISDKVSRGMGGVIGDLDGVMGGFVGEGGPDKLELKLVKEHLY